MSFADVRQDRGWTATTSQGESGVFDRIDGFPLAALVDHLGLEKTDDRLGQCIVIRVALVPTEH